MINFSARLCQRTGRKVCKSIPTRCVNHQQPPTTATNVRPDQPLSVSAGTWLHSTKTNLHKSIHTLASQPTCRIPSTCLQNSCRPLDPTLSSTWSTKPIRNSCSTRTQLAHNCQVAHTSKHLLHLPRRHLPRHLLEPRFLSLLLPLLRLQLASQTASQTVAYSRPTRQDFHHRQLLKPALLASLNSARAAKLTWTEAVSTQVS